MVVHQSHYKAVKCCFVMENLCNKCGKVAYIKSLLLDFTPKIKYIHKTKCIVVILTQNMIELSSEPHGFSAMYYGALFVSKLTKIIVFKWQLQVYKHCFRFIKSSYWSIMSSNRYINPTSDIYILGQIYKSLGQIYKSGIKYINPAISAQ